MKLLSKDEYNTVEELLRTYGIAKELEEPYKTVKDEIIKFFDVPIYKDFLKLFYFERHKYRNKYPENRAMMGYLSDKLYVAESQLYAVRKEIIYKSAMILYKYGGMK